MEGAGVVPQTREVARRPDRWRIAAGVGVLVVLVLIGVLLAPPYYHDWQLRGYLQALVSDPATANRSVDLIRALVVDKAAGLGLPVRMPDVHVTRNNGRVTIEVVYIVHIDLPVYTVGLHFRPGAG
jgi:hypothetical protein